MFVPLCVRVSSFTLPSCDFRVLEMLSKKIKYQKKKKKVMYIHMPSHQARFLTEVKVNFQLPIGPPFSLSLR